MKEAADHPRIAPGSTSGKPRGRAYPRWPSEAGDLGAVGDRRVVGMAALWSVDDALGDLRDDIVTDLGGAGNLSAARREVLELAIAAERVATMLLSEIGAKAQASRAAGRTPCPSRYRATTSVATFLALAGRLYQRVGLERVPRQVEGQDLRSIWASSDHDGRGAADSEGDGVSTAAGGDRPASGKPADDDGDRAVGTEGTAP